MRPNRRPPRLLEVIPNGVAPHPAEVPARARDRREPIRFGALGTVKPVKGTDLLVEAFMQFTPAHRVELVIAGLIDRPWAEALRDRAATDPRVRFVGRSSAPREFLSGLDVFVLPSRSEGMSNALLEAMAAALPCIATDVGSNRSLLCPPGESPAGVIAEPAADSLFQAMRTMAAMPGRPRALRRPGRRVCPHAPHHPRHGERLRAPLPVGGRTACVAPVHRRTDVCHGMTVDA